MTVVRQARLSDWAALDRFIDAAYESLAPWKGAGRRTWQFVDNPFRAPSEDLASVWVAMDGDLVVGQIAVQAASLQIDGTEHQAGWIVDVMILSGHRGTGLGHRIHDAVAGESPLLVTLTMAPATRRIAERAGCVTLAPTREFARLVHLDHKSVRDYLLSRTERRPVFQAFARIFCDILQAHRSISWIANGFLRWQRRKTPASLPNETVEIVEVRYFDEELDRFWERVRHDYAAIFVRNSKFLNWRFIESPDLRYRCFIARRSGQCVGYFVIRHSLPEELSAGHIVDFLVARDDDRAFEAMIAHAAGAFGKNVAAITCVTSIPEFERSLRKHGFRAVRTVQATVVCRDPTVRNRIEALKDSWYFTKGDHDWDQVHLTATGS